MIFFSKYILSENQDALMVGGNINQSVAIKRAVREPGRWILVTIRWLDL